MIVKKKNRKIKFILTDELLVVKRMFKDKIIERENIRSAVIAKSALMILTYDNKVYRFGCIENSFEYIEGLKLLVKEINKEDIVFSNWQSEPRWMFVLIIMNSMQLNLFQNYDYLSYIYVAFLLLWVATLFYRAFYSKRVAYNVSKNQFFKFKMRGKILDTFSVDDVKIKYSSYNCTKYKYKNHALTFSLENRYEKIIYPLNCVHAVESLKRKNV